MSTDDRETNEYPYENAPVDRQTWPMTPDRDPNRQYGQGARRRRHPFLKLVGLVVLLFVVVAGVKGLASTPRPSSDVVVGAVATTTSGSGVRSAVEVTSKAAPKMTGPERQAIRSAKSYLAFEGFSRAGLIAQLTSKYGGKFKHADAVYAVDHITVSWRKQAVRSAKSYLEFEGFSRAGLIDQLTSKYGSQYTHSQAVYAADKVGL